MENGLTITVNLPGRIGGSVRHTETQAVKANVSTPGKKAIWKDVDINHTDRPEQDAYLKINISPEVLQGWVGSKPPHPIKPRDWQKYSRNKKIAAYVADFDRGFGVTFDMVD